MKNYIKYVLISKFVYSWYAVLLLFYCKKRLWGLVLVDILVKIIVCSIDFVVVFGISGFRQRWRARVWRKWREVLNRDFGATDSSIPQGRVDTHREASIEVNKEPLSSFYIFSQWSFLLRVRLPIGIQYYWTWKLIHIIDIWHKRKNCLLNLGPTMNKRIVEYYQAKVISFKFDHSKLIVFNTNNNSIMHGVLLNINQYYWWSVGSL